MPVHGDILFKNTAVCADHFLAGRIVVVAGDEYFVDIQALAAAQRLTEHFLRVASAPFVRAHIISDVPAPRAEDGVVDMVAQLDDSDNPVVALAHCDVDSRRNQIFLTGFF